LDWGEDGLYDLASQYGWSPAYEGTNVVELFRGDARVTLEPGGVIEYSSLNPGAGPAIVYAPFYLPKTHPKFARDNSEFIEEVLGYLPRLNPAFRRDWVLATHCHRYDFAQTISPPGFYAMLPPMRTPIEGLFMADTSYYYPEDRSIAESARVGRILAAEALATG